MQLPLFDGSVVVQPNRTQKHKHQSDISYSSARNEWQTPQSIIEHAVAALGSIDLDPCSNSKDDSHVPAKVHFTAEDNSLSQHWEGRVWLNPPSGRAITPWIEKLRTEYESGGVTAAVVLVPARTDTRAANR